MTIAGACAAAVVAGSGAAWGAPAADSQGYVNSTARCASAAELVVYGSTDASRVAICDTADGLQYRGVRVRDGARLILSASENADGAYVATNDGVTYTVSAEALEISAGSRTLREESMTDFHTATGASSPAPSTTTSTPTPTTTSSTPVDPDQPPLPAEVGGSGG